MIASRDREMMIGRGRGLRRRIRAGEFTGQTAGRAPGLVQANLAVLPARHAGDFDAFCAANARACPLLFRGRPGDPRLDPLGSGIDVRHDLPAYHVFRDGAFAGEVTDIAPLWRDDLVTYLLGCSYTFDAALREAGVRLLHIEAGREIAVYRTACPSVRVGPFGGELIVSMRPVRRDQLDLAWAVTAEFPMVHGAPVHAGDGAVLGIRNLAAPDWGPPPFVPEGWIPTFWACGVTAQSAVLAARLDLAITHKPSHLLITDLLGQDLRRLLPGRVMAGGNLRCVQTNYFI